MLASLLTLFALADASVKTSMAGAPAFDKVLTMLQNLITQIETEEATDQGDYAQYQSWFTQQSDSTDASIGLLQTRLSELGAVIADLTSRQHNLGGEVGRLNGEMEQEQSQIAAATTKRGEENEAFVKEQLDFDNSIAACNKAAEMLTKHYGDGKPKESSKPAWLSLLGTLKAVVQLASKHHHKVPKLSMFLQAQHSFLQQPNFFNANGASLNDQHQDSTGEAVSIVEQVKNLAATFADDKQSSVDQEGELKKAFENLMGQKQALLTELTGQRDMQQSTLNQVNQELGENQNAEATAKATLLDEQAYKSTITTQEEHTSTSFHQRVEDRAAEKTAVSGAVTVLMGEAPALLQGGKRAVRRASLALKAPCAKCHAVSGLLLAESKHLASDLLATAAMAAGSGDALAPVIGQLSGLVSRIDEQQHAEEEHKNWCENELSATAKTKSQHEALVTEFTAKIADTKAVLAEKQQAILDTAASISDADKTFQAVHDVRAKAKADFEVELQDYKDSVAALNQAIDLLADFYRDQAPALVQSSQPDMSQAGSYSKKGGAHVVETLKLTREDFSAGQRHLEEQEKVQESDFDTTKSAYEKTRADLVDAGNRFQAELQGAQLTLAQAETDLGDNKDKVQAATTYLGQVGGSCSTLIDNFASRSQLRAEEKTALQKAVEVLQAA